MARKKRTASSRNHSPARRDALVITNQRLPRPKIIRKLLLTQLRDDSRRSHPNVALKRQRDIFGRTIRRLPIVGLPVMGNPPRSRPNRRYDPLRINFALPKTAVVCARRQIRKEVMFAIKKAGRGGQKRPRRNANSNTLCRR